ncbi:thiamine-phosphate kinase [Phormidium tenue FACHB-886]|nr:thiamine-phosphate kinase [Phormidium tenue FACHB-886]
MENLRDLRVKEFGEQGLLQRLQAFCPAEVIGDDAAVLSVEVGYRLVVTTDTLVDGVHFSVGMAAPHIQTTSPYDAGWRAVAANLSDLAAMGAAPIGITIGLALPGDLPVAWVEQLYEGMTACLQPSGTAIVGGDVCRSPVLSVNITALGQVLQQQGIYRAAAQPGDAILVTGAHGASRAGLELLLHPEEGKGLTDEQRHGLIQAHQHPVPRLDVVERLRSVLTNPLSESSPASIHYWAAGMDSSDGLADAVLQICRASGVGAKLDRRAIPLPKGLSDWVGEKQAIEWALYGGEDFELVLCLPQGQAAALLALLRGAAIVGQITAEPGVILQDSQGEYPDEILSLNRGFQHFG